mgnify:FL=1
MKNEDKLKMFNRCSALTQLEILEDTKRLWVSFDCGYGQELVSYTVDNLIYALNGDEYKDPKHLVKRDGVYCEPFGKFTKNVKWFDNYFECRQYTDNLRDKESA